MLVLLHLKLISNPRLINIALDYQPFEFINPDGQRSLAANDPKFSLRKAAKMDWKEPAAHTPVSTYSTSHPVGHQFEYITHGRVFIHIHPAALRPHGSLVQC